MAYGGAAMGVPTGSWTTGVCGCCEDLSSSCCVVFCPCLVVGRNVNIITDGFTESTTACCLFCLLQSIGLGCLYSCGYRKRLREKYYLPPKPCNDFCTHFFCMSCALCQENRELKNRGWNPKLGFAANVRQFQARGQPPPLQSMAK